MKKNLEKLEKTIDVSFNNLSLLKESLTHRSYINENSDWPVPHNERLEFLGDAVLEIIVTEFLFNKYPKADEGKLTSIRSALVNHNILSSVAKKLKLDDYVFLSKGEKQGSKRARDAILANSVEALIGAIYIDQNYEAAEEFIKGYILSRLDEIMEEELYNDPKSLLQEIVQEEKGVTPHYKVLEETGPDHKKEFVVGAFFGEELVAKGRGQSKQESEREAASEALKIIEQSS